jgi:hypothetical protein
VTAELAVAITDHKPRLDTFVFELHEQVSRLLSYPRAVEIRRDPSQMHATGRQLDERRRQRRYAGTEPASTERETDQRPVAAPSRRRIQECWQVSD